MWAKTNNVKDEIRDYILNKRKKLSPEEKKIKDDVLYNIIIKSKEFIEADTLFLYISFDKEVDTHNIINHALSLGKKVCVPRVISRLEGMKALKIDSLKDLQLSNYGILEPEETAEEIMINHMDLAIVPGVAFDPKGGRVGYGGGFYDRFFSNLQVKIKKIALAYEFQILDRVPIEEHDISIDAIITEKCIREIN